MWIVRQNNHIKNMKNPLTVFHRFQTQKKLPAPSERNQSHKEIQPGSHVICGVFDLSRYDQYQHLPHCFLYMGP